MVIYITIDVVIYSHIILYKHKFAAILIRGFLCTKYIFSRRKDDVPSSITSMLIMSSYKKVYEFHYDVTRISKF